MKKKSRFLTGLLSAVMALSLFALPASAAAGDGEYAATPSSINVEQKGKITIYKYIYNGTASEENRKGTGEEETDASKVPNGEGNEKATPLQNVEFTAYQVMDATALVKYYDSMQNANVPTVKIGEYVQDNAIIAEKVTEKKDDKIVGHTATTDKNGMAVIPDLKVGLYAVVETKHPAGVTKPTAAFLVSIPMTKQSTTTDASQKSEWMYDVTVYPKNTTAAAPITLQKKGVTGGDDADATTEMSGYEFKLEKWDGTQWVTLEKASKDGQDNAGEAIAKTDGTGKILIASLTPGVYRFTEVSGPADSEYIIDKDTHYLFKVTENSKIEQVAAADGIPADSNNNFTAVDGESKTVTVVNNKPDLEKKVQNTDKANPYGEAADYGAGDMVPYKVTVKVPKNIDKLTTFKVTDTPKGLTDKTETINITVGDTKLVEGGTTTAAGGAISSIKSVDDGFEIVFDPSKMTDYAGKELVITYQAELKGKADNTTSVVSSNTARLTYTNVIDTTTDPKPEESTRYVEDDTVVYSFKLIVNKVGESAGKKKPLVGVKFDLYKEVEEGGITDTDATAVGLDGTKHWLKIADVVTGDGGVITKNGLANGNYYLVETKTVEDYNLLSKPVNVVLNKKYEKHSQEEYTNVNGNVTHQKSEKLKAFKEDDTTAAGPSVSVTVINRKGFDLPVTGGFGTLLFSAIGALLVVGGVGVLMSTKKKKKGNA